jgi:hypothetical protein
MVSLLRLRAKLRAGLLEATHQLESLAVRRRLNGRPSALETQVVGDLRTEGVHVTTIERLLPQSAPALYQAFRLALDLLHEEPLKEPSRVWRRGAASNDLRADVMLAQVPELYLLGLEPRLLVMVQQYLRLPVAYHGAVIRHSLVDGVGAGPRLWHQDGEDFHVLRMVVYLNDVTLGGGPFEYIPRTVGVSYKQFGGVEEQLTNERMSQVVPLEQWRRIYGPAGTVVLADTAQVFHHESLQTERDRAVIMIGYSSRRPKSMYTAMEHFPVEQVAANLRRVVPPENHAHVFGWRRPMYAAAVPARERQGGAA